MIVLTAIVPDHNGLDSHGSRCAHGMEGQHDAENSPEEPDIRGIGCDCADDDQPFGQGNFECLRVWELGQIDPAIKHPAFDGHGH